ncbi:MAG: acetaldehyde dehydrogenase / alcohol dehydrogenase [Solirubrobacteraceae bacterium]|nr:acetaldehyde dehydrogenase / alcohol dehydrogenase [Solirubrobacteraceae bacterium]
MSAEAADIFRSASRAASVMDAGQLEMLVVLEPHMQAITVPAGSAIFRAGDPSDAIYVIDAGDVRVEVRSHEVDTDAVLEFRGPGSFLGDTGVLAKLPRWTSAFAHTDVEAHRVSADGLRRVYEESPVEGLAILRALSRDTAARAERAARQLADHLSDDQPDPEVERLVAGAVAAQRAFETWPEDRVDALLKDIAGSIAGQAEELARLTVEETHIGNVAHKVLKINFASLGVYSYLEGKPGYGVIREDAARKVVEMASPVGVVVGLVPVTNPVPTFVNKALIALKARNSIILSPHRMAQGVSRVAGEIVQGALARHDAPPDLVQWFEKRTSRKQTAKLMRHADVGMILATGGPGMVKAAYSSGKPAIGVGAGNAPAWVAPDADVEKAAAAVMLSKGFDYGLICGSEQHLVVDASIREAMLAALQAQGAVVLDAAETAQFVAAAFTGEGDLHMHFVGQSAATILEATGLGREGDPGLVVFQADAEEPGRAMAHERLAPVLSMFTVDGDDEAIALCRYLLDYAGAGHTANIHTEDEARIQRFAREMPASRILVNAPSAAGCCGMATGLAPSLTLGCGTFGGNSTTDNVTHENLMNIKRLAYVTV